MVLLCGTVAADIAVRGCFGTAGILAISKGPDAICDVITATKIYQGDYST